MTAPFPVRSFLYFLFLSHKHKVDQEHIADGAHGDAQESIFAPQMHPGGERHGDQLGHNVVHIALLKILKTIDDENAQDRYRQHIAQVLHELGHLLFAPKQGKGKQAGGKGTGASHQYHDQ